MQVTHAKGIRRSWVKLAGAGLVALVAVVEGRVVKLSSVKDAIEYVHPDTGVTEVRIDVESWTGLQAETAEAKRENAEVKREIAEVKRENAEMKTKIGAMETKIVAMETKVNVLVAQVGTFQAYMATLPCHSSCASNVCSGPLSEQCCVGRAVGRGGRCVCPVGFFGDPLDATSGNQNCQPCPSGKVMRV